MKRYLPRQQTLALLGIFDPAQWSWTRLRFAIQNFERGVSIYSPSSTKMVNTIASTPS